MKINNVKDEVKLQSDKKNIIMYQVPNEMMAGIKGLFFGIGKTMRFQHFE